MILKNIFKNPETVKRLKHLKSNKKTTVSCWIFLFLIFLSITAEFWSNSKPIFLSWEKKWYFPVLKNYYPSDLNLKTSDFTIDYRSLDLSGSNWAIWPLVKWNPLETNIKEKTYPSAPSAQNWLGTDDRGRDILARLIYGFRYSMSFAFTVWIFSYLLGTFLGALMGFIGGWLDLIGQRFVEIIETVPFLLLCITLVDLLKGSSFWILVTVMVCFRWINISYYMRAEFLKLRKREFVDICHAQGMKPLRVMFKHILPNALNPILTFSPFSIATAVTVLAILDYLGFGLKPPTPSWGELLLQAEKHFTTAWWLALFPSLALFSTLMLLTFIGDGLRQAFDPRKDLTAK